MQTNKITYRKHGICLIAVFILGNTLLTFPSGSDAKSGIYALILALIPSLLFFGIYAKLSEGNSSSLIEGKAGSVVAIPLLLIALFGIVMCCRDYTLFIDTMRLPNTSLYVITGIFVALGFLLGLAPKKVLYLFSLLSLIVSSAVLLIMLIFSVPNIKGEYLGYVLKPDIPAIFRQGAGIFIHSLGQCVLLIFLLDGGKKSVSQQYLGLGFGTALLGLSFFNVLTVLGSITTRLSYPYISVAEMVTFGRGYSRMEGLSYAVYFLCALIKTSVLIKVSVKIAGSIHPRFKRAMYFLLPLVALLGVSRIGSGLLRNSGANIFILVLELVVPVVLLAKKTFSKAKS